MNKKNLYKISALLSMTLMLGAFTHCVSEAPSNKSSSSSSNRAPTSNNTGSSSSSVNEVAAIQTSTGVKNHEQLLYTMAELTGVPASTTQIKTVYNQVSATLPTTNEVKSLLAPNQVAIVKLAAEFCNQLMDNANVRANRDAMFAPINFQAGATNLDFLTTPANSRAFVGALIDNFWGGMISENDLMDAEDELMGLLSDLAMGEANSSAGARKVAKGVCTAALSSAHVTLL